MQEQPKDLPSPTKRSVMTSSSGMWVTYEGAPVQKGKVESWRGISCAVKVEEVDKGH